MRHRRHVITGPRAAALAMLIAGSAVVAVQAGAVPGTGDGDDDQGAGTSSAARPAGLAPKADFDKDGYEDLAVSAPKGNVGDKAKAGYVSVVSGSAKGTDTGHRQLVNLDSPGVGGEAAEEDKFGSATVARDFNGDGYTDLAASVDNYYDIDRRFVTMLWGSADGLTSGSRLNVKGEHDGYSIAGGDFDGDGTADLATTANSGGGVDVLYGPFKSDGTPARHKDLSGTSEDVLALTAGDVTGDGKDDLLSMHRFEETAEKALFWKGGPDGLTTSSKKLDPAATGTVGDVDKDGYGDFIVRAIPDGFVDTLKDQKGTIKVYYGSASGPGTRTRTITQDTSWVPGTGEKGDQFGYDVSAGDVNGDGYADVAVGVPYETLGDGSARKNTGDVLLFKGGRDGLSTTGVQSISQATAGMPGAAEAKDLFGSSLLLRDVDGDGKADLGIGAPGEDTTAADSGAAWVLRGTAGGLTTDGAVSFAPGDLQAPVKGAQLGRWTAE